ncbi:hypothetical protein PSECIP111854_02044 [Pseudoalteromonas sp. CIP111854]|uniref:Uncharacterized protein n=1 Tax=Pseudoalteromonas holothuriae TaxID=2963714 RepID=A0A9W4QX23_9GAMM|nr:hypothetical protein [Pseudoalteromonas sp. CIP111854]CAH9057669.1 hypothetical protein PSECIP111854_02044 [Pseudoalteromonas sp. CIP111854]
MTDTIFDSQNQSVTVNGVTHLTNPLTGESWQNEQEVAEYFAPEPEVTEQAAPWVQASLTDVAVTGEAARLVGDIHWVKVGTEFVLTANLLLSDEEASLPESLQNCELMLMCERVVDGKLPIDDMRYIASIQDGKVTLNGQFVDSGNYVISEERVNRGLERINAPFRLTFDTVEFDAYL